MGFFDKIKKIGIFNGFSQLDDDFYDELEESLVMADMGADTTMEAVEELKRRCKERKIKDVEGARSCMRELLCEYLTIGDAEVDLSRKPAVVLFIGVNGVGKTTSIGKLAARWKREGKKVLLCAGDTFRAAAADQLTIWSERAGVDIIKQHEGADPAAVVYDAMSAAKARRVDAVLVDTAGRLHNKQNLMNELNKISRVIDPGVPRLQPGDPAGAGCHHGAERSDPGQAVFGDGSGYRHCADQVGRHRQGRYRHRHSQRAGRSSEICGYGRGCG